MERIRQRLGVYIDAPFRARRDDGGRPTWYAHTADYSLVGVFLGALGEHFESVTIFGRLEPGTPSSEFAALCEGIELAPLPNYNGLVDLIGVGRASVGTLRRMWSALAGIDTLLVFGPHPFALPLALLARMRGKRCVLAVRQDTRAYFRSRLPSRRWRLVLWPLDLVELAFRRLARERDTLVAGPELARQYGGEGVHVKVMADSVVRAADVAAGPKPDALAMPVELLTVGRVDAEKNPLLVVDMLAELDAGEPGRYRLSWVGGGPMLDEVSDRARSLGIADRLSLLGWIPYGPEVIGRYRAADLFVHVSRTEGAPRVLYEAQACATPIVATDVGGVRALLDDGEAGVLVPAEDLAALVAGVRRLAGDGSIRRRLALRGLELARARTLERQAAEVAEFVSGGSPPHDAALSPGVA